MQWKTERVACLFSCLGLCVVVAGCRPTPSALDVPATPYRGVELRIACPNESTAAVIRSFGEAWALRQGAKLAIELYDPGDEKALAGRSEPGDDVWILPVPDLPRWAASGQLATVPLLFLASENAYGWSDLLPTYREQFVSWEGKPYGFPLMGEAPVCCYRADLFATPAHQTAFRKHFRRELVAPATWAQFAQLAEYFQQSDSSAPSLTPLPKDDAELDRQFYAVAAGYARRAVPADEVKGASHQDDVFSFHYDLKTGLPRIDAPGFVQALKLLQRLQTCRPKEAQERPEEAFRAGRAVLCLTDAPWIKTFQHEPALRDKIGICRLPGGERYFDFETGQAKPTPGGNRVPYLGGSGWLAVVPRGSRHVEAAFDLLAECSSNKTSTQIYLGEKERGGPIRTDQLYRSRWDTYDVDEKQELHLREALQEALLHRGLKNPALCLRTPRQAKHRALLVPALREALVHGIDAEKTMRNVAEAWRKLDSEQGLEAHKMDYRRSLGLLGSSVGSKQ